MNDEMLRAFLDALWAEPAFEPPVNETWKELIARINGGGNQRIDCGTYAHFQGCLLPHYHGGDFFAHCDGREPLKLFARRGGFLCRQLTWEQSLTFCRLAGIDDPD